jgi:uncharacterized phiE125 gp8 family phage protein
MSWSLVRTTEPSTPVVSVSDAKIHLRVDHNTEDQLIARIVDASTEQCESFQRRAYCTQTWRLTLPRFPHGRVIRLPRPPLQSVDSITYRTPGGDTVTLSTDAYRINGDATPGEVILNRGHSWPSTAYEPDAIQITYVAGYGDAADIPAAERSAVLLYSGHLYENRETVTVGTGPTFRLPMGPEYLLYPNRVFEFDPLGAR